MTKDYYEVLGVKPGATIAEIRAAYKKLARKYHPDANRGSKSAEESFKEVSEAYQVLSNTEKRRQYDAIRSGGGFPGGFPRGQAPGGAGGGWWPFGGDSGGVHTVEFGEGGIPDLGSIFSDLFGRAAPGAGGHSRGSDLEYEATLEFEEAIRGTTITAPMARHVTCGTCRGSGQAAGGGRSRRPCATCGGSGVERSTDTISVRIPPGAENGSRVRVAGKGDAGMRGGPPGDLYIVLRVKPHRYFRREGKDLILDLPLTYTEAALGLKIDVPTLGGRTTLTIPAGTRSGQRLRLRGKGVPGRGGGAAGDQIVIASIVPPKKIDSKMKKLLAEFAKLDSTDPRKDLDW